MNVQVTLNQKTKKEMEKVRMVNRSFARFLQTPFPVTELGKENITLWCPLQLVPSSTLKG